MALLESLDQRETPDRLVSSWAWNAAVCRSCLPWDRLVDVHRSHPRKKEEGCWKVALGSFRED